MTTNPEAVTADLHYAVTILATALDNLGARIHRDIHIDSSYIPLPVQCPDLIKLITDFSAYSDKCMEALHNPVVVRALAGAK